MGKRQTRRSISIRGLSYQRLQDYCEQEGRTISGWLEDVISERMAAVRFPEPTVLRPRPASKRVKAEDLPSFFHSGITTL